MPLTDAEITRFRKLVAEAKRPLILFDDDCDGVASCVMLYHAIGDGRVIPVKKTPQVHSAFARKVQEYGPDVVFILDKPLVSDDFFEQVRTPVVWLDHHPVQRPPKNVTYFNPRKNDDADNTPTSYWIWKMVGKPEDLWLAAVGTVGDWYVPDFMTDMKRQYDDLLPDTWKEVGDLYVDTKLSDLILLFNIMLKGTVTEAMNCIKTLLKVESPYEILDQTTPRGKYLWKRFDRHARNYKLLLAEAKAAFKKQRGKLLVFEYHDDTTSYTKELSNELLIRYPERFIIVARHHNGSVKASLRSYGPPIVDAVTAALEGVNGHGGGHDCACGAGIDERDWPRFLDVFTQLINNLINNK